MQRFDSLEKQIKELKSQYQPVHDPNFKLLNNNLKEIRKKHSFTQTELAEKLGITRSAIAQIESGKNNVSLEVAKKASKLFGIKIDDLVKNDYSKAKC